MTAPLPHVNYRERVRQRLRVIVEDAAGEPPISFPIEMREAGPNAWAELVVRWRCHPRLAEPDELEREILDLLYRRGRLRAAQILRELEGGDFSIRTIERRLRLLTRLGVITCRKRSPRGYDLDPRLRANTDACPGQSC